MIKLAFKGKGECGSGPLDLIHTDVCGSMSMYARGGFIYSITFTDDFLEYGWVLECYEVQTRSLWKVQRI